MLGHILDAVHLSRDGLAKMLVNGDHAFPDGISQIITIEILQFISGPTDSDLATSTDDLDLEDAGTLHLGAIGGDAGVTPPIAQDGIGDLLHCPEFLVGIGDDGGVAIEGGGAIIDVVSIWGQSEDQAIDFGGGYGDREARGIG